MVLVSTAQPFHQALYPVSFLSYPLDLLPIFSFLNDNCAPLTPTMALVAQTVEVIKLGRLGGTSKRNDFVGGVSDKLNDRFAVFCF